MPAYSIQFRRGTAADHSAFTGELAEITIDITNNRVVLHDGETAGGIPLAKVSDLPIDVGDLTDVNGHIAAASVPSSNIAWGGPRGFSMGGEDTSRTNAIEYFDISTGGAAGSFGILTLARSYGATASSGTRALYASGGVSMGPTNTIDYVTCASVGNATDFGDVTGISGTNTDPTAGYVGRTGLCGVGDGTYGIFMGGQIQSSYGSDVIDRVTIDTPGNATDIGNLTNPIVRYAGSTNDDTRGINIGGYNQSSYVNATDYITMATAAGATSFGTLLQNIVYGTSGVVSNNTVGVFGGGYHDLQYVKQTVLQQITIQTAGTSTSFGNLSTAGIAIGSTTDGTTAVFLGGQQSGYVSDIDKLTIDTGGTATNHGDLTTPRAQVSGVSGNAA